MKPSGARSGAASRIIAGLDVGTSKICTVIAELVDGSLDIIGEGTVPAEGIKRGMIVNLERATAAIRQSISQAERVAGVRARNVILGVGGLHVKAMTSHGLAAIRRHQEITRSDVERAIDNAKAVPLDSNLEIIHVLPQEYVVDGQEGIKDPSGMQGVRLEVDVHLVACMQGPLANLRRCANEAGVGVSGIALQVYASGLAVLDTTDEQGTTLVIDIGGHSADIGLFHRGNLAYSAVVPFGGEQVTTDLAQILKIPFEQAERIKKKHGSALPEMADPDLVLEISQGAISVTAVELAKVIRPRIVEILTMIRSEIEQKLGNIEGFVDNIVITGGCCQLKGFLELMRERFKIPVRLGLPQGLSGLDDVVASSAHSTAVGLIRYGAIHGQFDTALTKPRTDFAELEEKEEHKGPGFWDRVRGIFKDFF